MNYGFLLLISILLIVSFLNLMYIFHPSVVEVLKYKENLVGYSVQGFCESLERNNVSNGDGKGQQESICSFEGLKMYKYRDIDVIEGKIVCDIDGTPKNLEVSGVFRGDDMFIDSSQSWLDKKMTIAHEYCHYKNWRRPIRHELINNGETCKTSPDLVKLMTEEENECYSIQIMPFNWI